MSELNEQWASMEPGIRDAIDPLPDADEFTQEDIGRIILRVRRINRDVIDSSTVHASDEDLETLNRVFQPVYHYLIGEIAALLIDNARLVRIIEGRAKPSDTYDGL